MFAHSTHVGIRRLAAFVLIFALLVMSMPHAAFAQEPVDPLSPPALEDFAAYAASLPAETSSEPEAENGADLEPVNLPEYGMVEAGAGYDPALGAREDGGSVETVENPAAAQEIAIDAADLAGVEPGPDEGPQEPISCVDADCPVTAAGVDLLSYAHSQLWHQNTTGIPGGVETSDQFGKPLAAADFNGDGRDELVVGVPWEDLGVANAGVVFVIPGRTDYLPTGAVYWSQDSAGVPGVGEIGDRFGSSLATGDFDGDGWADLAIGSPGESDLLVAGAGAVVILYGGLTGLTSSGAQLITQNTTGIPDSSETNDQFGYSLAAGDFDDDGVDDLAVGAIGEPWIAISGAGQVTVIYGKLGVGLEPANSAVFSQATAGVEGVEEANDWFGYTLAAGYLNPDAFADLAIGVPYEDHAAMADGGVVHILHGSATGLTAAGSAFLHQDAANIGDTVEASEWFGLSLATGNRDGDSDDELFVGVVGEDYVGAPNAGAVQMISHVPAGYRSEGSLFSRLTTGVSGDPTTGEMYGGALATGDFDYDGRADLVVGSPYQTISGQLFAGGFTVLNGIDGPAAEYVVQNYSLNSYGIPGSANTGDLLGAAMAVGDFDGDQHADLLAGSPGRDYTGAAASGAVLVLYSLRQWFGLLPTVLN